MYTATRKSKGAWNLDQPHLTPVSRDDDHVARPCLLTESHVLCSNRMRARFVYVACCGALCCIAETARINDDILRPSESLLSAKRGCICLSEMSITRSGYDSTENVNGIMEAGR